MSDGTEQPKAYPQDTDTQEQWTEALGVFRVGLERGAEQIDSVINGD